MLDAWLMKWNPVSTSARCRSRPRRLSCFEGLEQRALLSGTPTVYTVNLTSDTGAGSGTTGDLAYCIGLAGSSTNSAGSVIQFDPTVFNLKAPKTIVLSTTLNLTGTSGPIVINGPAPGSTDGSGPFAVTLSGNDMVRVLAIEPGVTATLSGLALTAGLASGNGSGVWNQGNLTLSNCEVADDTAAGFGGGVENDATMTVTDCAFLGDAAGGQQGGGISNFGILNLTGSKIEGCTVSFSGGVGGGLCSLGSLQMQLCVISHDSVNQGNGGGVFTFGTATISQSTITDNSTGTSGGLGGGVCTQGSLTVVDSAICNNTTGGFGGGIMNASVPSATVSISYSTIAGNRAGQEGGGIYNSESLQAVNVTIADNIVGASASGGGLWTAAGINTVLINTIVAGNLDVVAAVFSPDDIGGAGVTSLSTNNLIGTGGPGNLINGTDGNLVGVADPGLGSLAYNGGPTPTIALKPISPAINTGTNFSTGATTDQRGAPRIYHGGIDIGAYELQPADIAAVTVDWGSSGSAAVRTAPDGLRLLPEGRQTDLPWLGINRLQIALRQPEALTAADVTITGLKGASYGPVAVAAAQSDDVEVFLYDITLARPIDKPDRVTITIAGPEIVSVTRRLDVLPGDFYDTGVVTNKDLTAIRNESTGKHGATPTIFGEITGDGTVNASDYKAARRFQGDRLPKLPKTGGKPPKVVLDRALARQHQPARPKF